VVRKGCGSLQVEKAFAITGEGKRENITAASTVVADASLLTNLRWGDNPREWTKIHRFLLKYTLKSAGTWSQIYFNLISNPEYQSKDKRDGADN
jgi:hypothetical protein